MTRPALFGICMLLAAALHGQQIPVLVTEQTLRANDEVLLLYTFAEGDEIVFDLEVTQGRHMREVEIVEFPSTVKFQDFKAEKITNQRIRVNKTAVYQFRIDGGGSMGSRVCRFRISRVPASGQSRDFDTAADWRIAGDTIFVKRYQQVLASVDTSVVTVTDRTERVNAQSSYLTSGNTTALTIDLPKNRKTDVTSTELVSWAYWVGVGDEGSKAYEVEKTKFLLSNVKTIAALIDPLAGIALGAYTMLTAPPKGDNVSFRFTNRVNGKERDFVTGNSIVAHGRVTDFLQGSFRAHFENDNYLDGINVNLKVAAVLVHKSYVQIGTEEMAIRPKRK